MNHPIFLHRLSLTSFFGLMFTLLAWIILAPHGPNFPTAAMLILGVVPLLFPLRGLLHSKPYTHAWSSFLMLFYFCHSVGELYSNNMISYYAISELVFSALCFICSILFVKANAKLKTDSHK